MMVKIQNWVRKNTQSMRKVMAIAIVIAFAVSCEKEEEVPVIIVDTSEDQFEIENDGYQVTVSGTPLESEQTGKWRVMQGNNGTFDTPESAETVFRGEPGELYTLEWEITQGENYKTSWMNVSFKSMESIIHNEVSDTLSDTYTIHLKADSAKFGAAGTWQYDGEDGGIITDSTAAETTFVGQPNEDYTLRWVLTYGDAQASQGFNAVFDSVRAYAGEDNLRITATSDRLFYTLQAHLQEGAIGHWTVLSGTGGFIFADDNPNSLFEGVLGEIYTLLWEVNHGDQTDVDTVQIKFGGQHGLWVDERDDQSYRTVVIAGLEWMAENYNYAYDIINGSWYYGLAERSIMEEGEALMTEEERKRYGRVYTYLAAEASTPEGWRLPTFSDWDTAIRELGGYSYAANSMIEGGDSGLDIVQGGGFKSPWFSGDPIFFGQDQIGYYWCYNPEDDPWTTYTDYFNIVINEYQSGVGIAVINPPVYGFSVRYVRDLD